MSATSDGRPTREQAGQQRPAELSDGGDPQPARRSRWARFVAVTEAISRIDPAAVETAARNLGESRRWLAPLAWATGTLVLVVAGIKLLVVNWRLSLIQLVPVAWIWLATWDLKQHLLHGASLRQVSLAVTVLISIAVVALSIASFWCNTVFALTITGPAPPRIAPAARRSVAYRSTILTSGSLVGVALVVAAVIIPRTGRTWLFTGVLSIVIAVMLISFVAVPARIIGVRKQQLPPKEALGRAAARGTLSAVAMTPGFILDRIGLLLLGVPGLHVLGLVILSLGAALSAAGMSSVKVVTLSMKFTGAGPASDR